MKRAMIRKRHPPEEIVARLREVDDALALVKSIAMSPQVSHSVTITQVNLSRMNLKMSCNIEPTIRMIRAAQMVQKPEGRNHQRNRVEGNQCLGRIDEREDPEDQVAGLRLSQSSTLPQRDHVSPGRT